MPELTAKSRDKSFDLIKFVAIFMVVIWHVMSYRPEFNLKDSPSCVANFIISVNMPLFFMISGFFSRKLHEAKAWHRLGARLIGYFWPMAIFSFVFALVDCCGSQSIAFSDLPMLTLKRFLFCNWFFYTLAACDVITFVSWKYGRSLMVRWGICMCEYVACMAVVGVIWHSAEIVAMLPFYCFGLYLLPILLENKRQLVGVACVGVGAMILVSFFCGNIATNGLSFDWNRFHLRNPALKDALNMLLRFIVGILGSVSLISIVRFMMVKMSILGRISFLGTETLGVYFFQGEIIVWLSNRIVSNDSCFLILLMSSCFVFAICFALVKVVKANCHVRKIVFGK